MQDIINYTFDAQDVRVVTDERGDPWFVVKDVCDYFGVTNRNRVMQHVDAQDKGGTQMSTPGGTQEIATINESGLYQLLFYVTPTRARGISEEEVARKADTVRRFRRWVTHEVLPSIRKRGMYATPQTVEDMLADPDMAIRLLTEIKTERAERERLAAQIEADAPSTRFGKALSASDGDLLVKQVADTLTQEGLPVNQTQLFRWLREHGWLCNNQGRLWNAPTKWALENGYIRQKVTLISTNHGDRETVTPKITATGQQILIDGFLTGRFTLNEPQA